MTEKEFLALGRAGYNRIALRLETFADLDTPLSIYLKLANRPGSYLLESVIGGERFGRYSFIGLPARTLLRATSRPRNSTARGGRCSGFRVGRRQADCWNGHDRRGRLLAHDGLLGCGGVRGGC